jgi:hypothetical protein
LLFLSLSSLTLVPHQQNGELSWVINEDRNCNKFAIGTALSSLPFLYGIMDVTRAPVSIAPE